MPKRIGLKKFAVAVLKTDTAEALEYHKILQLAKNIKVDIKPKTAEGKLYADDALDESNSSVTGYDLSFEINQLELEDQALLLGHKIDENGMIAVGPDDQAPWVAVLFEAPRSDGSTEYRVLNKVKFMLPDETYETRGENLNYQTPKITAVSALCEHTASYGQQVVGNDTNKDVVENWYKKVQLLGGKTATHDEEEGRPKKVAKS